MLLVILLGVWWGAALDAVLHPVALAVTERERLKSASLV